MPDLRRLSSIGRPVDVRDPTNLAILAISGMAAAGVLALRLAEGVPAFEAAGDGAATGLGVFLAWALAREIDPDHPLAAFGGPALVLAYVVLGGPISAMYAFWALLALRLVNRTPGPHATWFDSAVTTAVALLLVVQGYGFVGVAMAAALAMDAVLQPANRKQWVGAAVALVGTLVLADLPELQVASEVTRTSWAVMGLAGAAMLIVIRASRVAHTTDDRKHRPLSAVRIRAAQGFALVAAFLTVVIHGAAGLAATVPLWAAMLSVGAYHLVTLLWRVTRRSP